MILSIYNSISTLAALGKKMSVTANNVANIESEGFKKSRVVFKEEREGLGLRVEIDKINTPGSIVQTFENGRIVGKELSNVNLAEELPVSRLTKRCYEANLKVFETIDDMLGMVINIKE